jgi:hypothetical protein
MALCFRGFGFGVFGVSFSYYLVGDLFSKAIFKVEPFPTPLFALNPVLSLLR